jgi:hypothetical protein
MDLKTALRDVCQMPPWWHHTDRGRCAWQAVFDAIEAKQLDVNDTAWSYRDESLLHRAADNASVAVMRRLLAMGASPSMRNCYGHVPLHLAAISVYEPLEKCRLLPATDLTCLDNCYCPATPLQYVANRLWDNTGRHFEPNAAIKLECELEVQQLLQVLQWMVDQPECPTRACDGFYGRNAESVLFGDARRNPEFAHEVEQALAIYRAAEDVRVRWSPPRAAWTGAAAVVGGAAVKM